MIIAEKNVGGPVDATNSAETFDDRRRVPKRSLWGHICEVFCYLRGTLTSMRLNRRAFISSHGCTRIMRKNGRIFVGSRTRLWPNVKLSCVGYSPDYPAEIVIGHHCSLGDNVQVHSCGKVTLGNYVLIAWDTDILGRYYHVPGGGIEEPGNITIEDNVWIGCECVILKGVTIGRGAIIGAGSVVTRDVPPYTMAAGNPARVIKPINSWNGR